MILFYIKKIYKIKIWFRQSQKKQLKNFGYQYDFILYKKNI